MRPTPRPPPREEAQNAPAGACALSATHTPEQLRTAVPRDNRGREQRAVRSTLEIRAANEDGSIPFRGHAAVFNARTFIRGFFANFFEEIAPGAFRDVLDGDTPMLVGHNPELVVARTTAAPSSLRLSEDRVGLVADADIAPTTAGRDLAVHLERGTLNGMSFAFEIGLDGEGERWSETDDGAPLRTITRVSRLWDVSVVTYPQYDGTDAGLRDAQLRGLLRAMGLQGIDARAQSDLLSAIAQGRVSADQVPLLRSACTALGELACACERTESPPPDDRGRRRRQLRQIECVGFMQGGH